MGAVASCLAIGAVGGGHMCRHPPQGVYGLVKGKGSPAARNLIAYLLSHPAPALASNVISSPEGTGTVPFTLSHAWLMIGTKQMFCNQGAYKLLKKQQPGVIDTQDLVQGWRPEGKAQCWRIEFGGGAGHITPLCLSFLISELGTMVSESCAKE